MQRGSPPISPFAAIANIEKFDLTTSFFSSLLEPLEPTFGLDASMRPCFVLIALVWLLSGVAAAEDSSLSVALVGLDGQ